MPLAHFQSITFQHLGKGYTFRLLRSADYVHMQNLIDENLMHLRGPFPVTVEALFNNAKKWAKQKVQDNKDKKAMFLVLQALDTKEFAACISIFGFDWRTPKCEIAWMAAKNFEGKGLAGLCLQSAMQFLLETCKVKKIICRIDPTNNRSIALAKRHGFIYEGLHKKDFRDGYGRLLDVEYYGFWREESV